MGGDICVPSNCTPGDDAVTAAVCPAGCWLLLRSARSPGGMRCFTASPALCKLMFGTSLTQREEVNVWILGVSYKRPDNPKNNFGENLWSFLLDASQFPPPGGRCPALLLRRTAYHLSPWLQTAARRREVLISLRSSQLTPGSSVIHPHHDTIATRMLSSSELSQISASKNIPGKLVFSRIC